MKSFIKEEHLIYQKKNTPVLHTSKNLEHKKKNTDSDTIKHLETGSSSFITIFFH